MRKPQSAQRTFMPAFPKKSQKSKQITPKSKDLAQSSLKLSNKLCKDLCIINSALNSHTKILRYRNQNNFCEVQSMIMTPIRLTNIEISLPDFSVMSSPKAKSRKISTAAVRRRSVETKSIGNNAKVPAEIITTRCSARFSSQPMGIRTNNCSILSKSGNFTRSTSKNGNRGGFTALTRRGTRERTVAECESASPTAYSPIYTNNFDV